MNTLCIIIGIVGVLSLLFSLSLYFYNRKKIGHYIEKQTDLYSRIIDNMPFPVMLKDVNDDFKYIYWNKQCDMLSGYGRDRVLGNTDFDIYGQEMGGILRMKDLNIVNTGKPYVKQEQFITPDGVIHDTVVSKNILENEFKKWLLVVRWDITDLATVQRSLALANNQLHLAFASGNITPWIWDIQNSQLFFGIDNGVDLPSNVVTPKYIVDHTHPDDRTILVESLNELREGSVEKANFVVRFDFDLKFDKYYNIFSTVETRGKNGDVERIIGFMQDITEQKVYEEDLIVAKQKIEQVNKTNHIILDNSDVGLVFLTPDYIVQWENLSKYIDDPVAKAYCVGTKCHKNAKNLDQPCPGCVVSKAFESKRRQEQEIVNENNLVLQIVASPILDAANNCQGVVMKVKDITDDRRRENDLREAKERAEKSDKLKSAFLANMSHEIRTPLNAILGFSELLAVTDDQETKQEYIKVINSNNDLLLQLINDILDLSKIEANTLEFVYSDVNINDMMLDIERGFRFKVSSPNLEVVFEKQIDEKFIYTDRNRIQQVISNFITNALKFTDKGRIALGCERRGDNAYFYVSDTGMGIPEDKLADIFKRFTKLNNFKTGTGLGLTICQTIVHKLNGEIGVVSELGKGSTFWFTIPLNTDKVTHEEQPSVEVPVNNPAAAAVKVDGKATILIAEDTPDNYKLYKALLKDKYNLIHAWNGIEAVNMFVEDRPTVIFMDIKMPEMDGYEATAAIRELDKEIPIVAVTAFASETDKKQIYESGFNYFLAKPILSQALNEILNKLNI